MHHPVSDTVYRDVVSDELDKLQGRGVRGLKFVGVLERRFEESTAKARSHRFWREGLIAILIFNGCLLVDALLVKDAGLGSILRRTVLVTPLALVVNGLMRLNPPRRVREGSVALGITLICFVHLRAQGGATAATALFGVICLLIMALFAGVVMRLRLRYGLLSMGVMLAGGLWFLNHATGLKSSEKTVTESLLVIGISMTVTAAYGLEREERLGYLLRMQSEMQGEELAAMNEELLRLSNLDKLTGLPNRRALEDRFARLWMEGEAAQTQVSTIVIDVDHFKVINDMYGHLYGDAVLKRIAGLLPQALRGHADFAARFGGEEFVILMPATDTKTALSVAERMRGLVEVAGTPIPEHPSGETMLWATVSCGVSTCVPQTQFHRDNLIQAADKALYLAKGNGRNRVEMAECEWVLPPTDSRAGRRSGLRLLGRLGVRRQSGERSHSKAG